MVRLVFETVMCSYLLFVLVLTITKPLDSCQATTQKYQMSNEGHHITDITHWKDTFCHTLKRHILSVVSITDGHQLSVLSLHETPIKACMYLYIVNNYNGYWSMVIKLPLCFMSAMKAPEVDGADLLVVGNLFFISELAVLLKPGTFHFRI